MLAQAHFGRLPPLVLDTQKHSYLLPSAPFCRPGHLLLMENLTHHQMMLFKELLNVDRVASVLSFALSKRQIGFIQTLKGNYL